MTDWLYLTIVTGTPPTGTVPERTFLGWLILEIPEIILGHQALKAGIDFLVVEIINCMEIQQVRSDNETISAVKPVSTLQEQSSITPSSWQKHLSERGRR